MLLKKLSNLFQKVKNPSSFYVLNFSQDWCGSSYRASHLNENGSITILNSDLYWHGKTIYLDDNSLNAGDNNAPLTFKDEFEVLNYLFSLKFITTLTERNSYTGEARTVWGLRVTKVNNFDRFNPFGGETVYEFVERLADKECFKMLEKTLAEYRQV
jgi:hypothetical protein